MIFATKRQVLLGALSGLTYSFFGTSAWSQGKTHTVEMLNKAPDSGERQVFDPPVLRVEVGDTVSFVSTDRGHNSESNSDMMPAGAESWKSPIGKDIDVTFSVEGLYGYHCTPHRSAGMVGLVLVGSVSEAQIEAAKGVRQRGRAKTRYSEYFDQALAMLK